MSKNRYAAIICEYNPFHHGHLLQIELLKKEYDGIICIMSGNLVQRGEAAVADKYNRAKAAVMCGASLVVELPFPFSMLSARDFAAAGVNIAARLGVNALGFGCEDDFGLLERISSVTEEPSFNTQLEQLIKEEKNLSYPKAMEKLTESILGYKAAEIIKKPNNILTLEYLSAIKNGNYPIKPHPVRRDMSLRSSSSIRKERDRAVYLSMLPVNSAAVYGGLSEDELPRSTENLSQFIIGTLRNRSEDKKNKEYYGTPEDLYNSIMSTSRKVRSFSQLIDICQNSLYTAARVRRSVLSIVFDVRPNDALCKPLCTIMLAANKAGCAFLRNRKKRFEIPVLTKPSHINRKSEDIKSAFFRGERVDGVLTLSEAGNSESDTGMLRKSPFILDRDRLVGRGESDA